MKQILFMVMMMTVLPVALFAEMRELDTSRFRIVFDESDRYTAERLAGMADRVYERTTRFMNYEPRERIPVVVYGFTAEANGFFTSYPPHISLFVASPTGLWLGARADWLETLFVHELVHYLHLTQPVGFFGSGKPFFGPATTSVSLAFMPGWALEGPTVYAETALAPGGRGENPFFEMQHAAPVLEDRMYSYDQAGMSSPFAPSGRFYASGYLIVDHLLREYGDEAFNELNRHFQRWPFLGMRRAVRRTTGLTAPQLWDQVIAELEERWAYRLDIALGERVSPEGHGNWQLPVATDLGLVSYASGAYQVPGLYVSAAGGGGSNASGAGGAGIDPDRWQLLAPVQPTDEFSWTVDSAGTRAVVAVVSRERVGGSLFSNRILPSTSNLWVLDLSEAPSGARPADARQLTEGRQLVHPQLSPDGQRLVAIERDGSYTRLVSVDPGSGEVTHLLAVERGRLLTPTFSPDGSLLAVMLNRDGEQRILIVDPTEPDSILASGPDLPGGAEVHMPRFVAVEDGLELWYGGAYMERPGSQLLGLYRSRLALPEADSGNPIVIGRPELMIEDRIGAYAGFPYANDVDHVLYASYSSDGFVLRSAPAGSVDGERVASPPAVAVGGVREVLPGRNLTPISLTVGENLRYYDLPRPILYAPVAYTGFSEANDGSTIFANTTVGGVFIAASNLLRHEIELEALWHIQGRSPVGSLQYIYTPGQTSLTLNLDYDLSVQPWGADELRQSAGEARATLARTLWSRYSPGRTRSLSGTAGATYTVQRTGIFDGDTAVTPASTVQDLQVSAGLNLGSQHAGSARDWSTGTPGGSVASNTIFAPELLSRTEAVLLNISSATLRLHPWRSRRGLAGGVQFAATAAIAGSTSDIAGSYLPYRSVSAAETASASVSTTVAGLGRLEVAIPFPVADAAWRGTGFTSSAVSFSVEQALAAALQPVPETILGAELEVRARFNLVDWPLRAGVSARIPHSGEAGDTAVELYLGL